MLSEIDIFAEPGRLAHVQPLPEDIPDSAKGAKTLKGILGNLAMIAQGMAELRNLYGTGHGKHARQKRLSVRHATLPVVVASTHALFLFETYEARLHEARRSRAEVS